MTWWNRSNTAFWQKQLYCDFKRALSCQVTVCSRSHSLTYFFPSQSSSDVAASNLAGGIWPCRELHHNQDDCPVSTHQCEKSSLKDLIIKHSGNCALRCWNKLSRLHCSVTNQKKQTFNHSNFKVGPYQLQAGFVTPLIGVMTPLTHL